jgi:hypothetical protein
VRSAWPGRCRIILFGLEYLTLTRRARRSGGEGYP